MNNLRPRRSALYMPGSNARAQAKVRGLPTDVVIFDLEDAVAADAKDRAREVVADSVREGGYGNRELIVRVNGLGTPWGRADLDAVAPLPVAGVLCPKVESLDDVDDYADRLHHLPVWTMIETPKGVQQVDAIAAHERVHVLVMGTSDLVADLRARHTPDRSNLGYALQRCVLAGRAAGIDVLDGVHLDYQNQETFRRACEDGRNMGMDGKTLIHPTQIDTANEVFGVAGAEAEEARRIVSAWRDAQAQGKGVLVLDGRLIENLHVAEAERTLEMAAAIQSMEERG